MALSMEQEAAALFNQLDTDKNGKLSLDELRRVLGTLGLSEADIRTIAQSMDLNHDGFVSFKEFLQWTYMEPAWSKEMVRGASVVAAAGPDRNEVNHVLKCIHMSMKDAGWTIEALFRSADTDGNGFLSWDELWHLFRKWVPGVSEAVLQSVFNELDRDMNGWLSLREFGAALSRASDDDGISGVGIYGPTADELTRRELCLHILELRSKVDTLNDTMYKQGYLAAPPAPSQWRDLRGMQVQEMQMELPELQRRFREQRERVASGTTARSLALAGRGALSGPALIAESNLVGFEKDYGLRYDRRWQHSKAGPPTEEHRQKVKEGTKWKVAQELGLVRFGDAARCNTKWPPHYNECKLLVDQTPGSTIGNAGAGGNNLLARYEGLVVRAQADYGRDWQYLSGARYPFYVLHMAAINVGELGSFTDFADFACAGGLDEERYLAAMKRIFDNMVVATVTGLRVQHLVLYPFGMDSHLRHLNAIDRKYADELVLQRLRRRVAAALVAALCKAEARMQVHICLADGDREGQSNADAFIRALMGAPMSIQGRTTIWPGGDPLQLAHDLAQGTPNVLLVNGTSRRNLGNHWFGDGAKRAIDENLHRRSWTLAASSYLLSNFSSERSGAAAARRPEELRQTLEWMGGQTYVH
mmetsp:Transcript_32692/g.98841  ORF Transcript_32692/g.98841 Transcript_32692/m.98841 type:complete len:644 (-) Transcript_32692:24-1955(-)